MSKFDAFMNWLCSKNEETIDVEVPTQVFKLRLTVQDGSGDKVEIYFNDTQSQNLKQSEQRLKGLLASGIDGLNG